MRLDRKCSLGRFPNLRELVIRKDPKRARLAEVAAYYHGEGRSFLATFNVYAIDQVNWGQTMLEIRGFTPGSLSALSIIQDRGEPIIGELHPIMRSLILECCRLQSTSTAKSYLAEMESLTYMADFGLTVNDLDHIVRYCTSLKSLSVFVELKEPDDCTEVRFLSGNRQKQPSHLEDIEIYGGRLWWLCRLTHCKYVTLSCDGEIDEGWLREELLDERQGERQAKSCEMLELNLEFDACPAASNYYMIAKFVYSVISKHTAVTIKGPGKLDDGESTWLNNLRSTLAFLRDEDKGRHSGRKGWRVIATNEQRIRVAST